MNTLKKDFLGTKNKNFQFAIVVLIFVLLFLAPNFSKMYTIILFSSIIMYIIMTLSWTLFSGKSGYISLASAAFFGIGVYMSAVLGDSIPIPVVMVLSAIICFGLAVGIGIVTLRLRGVYFTIFTFGLVLLLQNLVLWYEIKFFNTKGRFVIAIDYQDVYYYMLILLVILIVASSILYKSRFGMALSCIGENEESAAHIGVNTTTLKVIAFGISAAPVGAAGAAMATRWSYIDPHTAFSLLMSFMPVLMAIFGGTHRLVGSVIGAIIFAYLEEKIITVYPEYYMIIFGIIMVVAIIFLPKGIIGLIEKIFGKIVTKKISEEVVENV